MFGFVIRYLGFLKSVPGLALLFDHWLKVCMLFTNPDMLDWIDDIEVSVLKWGNTTSSTHKYGGLQINYNGKEIGHIHSNGLLDMLLNRKIKQRLMTDSRIQDHHTFKNTGWISFYIKNKDDLAYAMTLLQLGHQLSAQKHQPKTYEILLTIQAP